MMPLNSISSRGTVGNCRDHEPIISQKHEVIRMMATETKTSFSRILMERITTRRIKRINLEEYRDDSIELRRYLASEAANIEFEQRKERALTENHRAGFMR